jgi:Uri superfamily endonuclease
LIPESIAAQIELKVDLDDSKFMKYMKRQVISDCQYDGSVNCEIDFANKFSRFFDNAQNYHWFKDFLNDT